MPQYQSSGDFVPCGVIVKYHPCSKHARGTNCPYFSIFQKCNKSPLTCQMPEYDKWFKEVLEGRIKCFYPNRILLFENAVVPMFLFHSHYRAIVGEATIVKATEEGEDHFYWFEKFISYSNPVPLEILETEKKVFMRARWRFIYILLKTVAEIRHLSKLSEEKRKEYGINLEAKMIELRQMRKRRPIKRIGKFCNRNIHNLKYHIDEICKKLNTDYNLNYKVLDEAQNIFFKAIREELFKGLLLEEAFYGSMYLAFRVLRIPRILADLSKMSGLPKKRIAKVYRLLLRNFNWYMPPQHPKQLVKTYAYRLGLSEITIDEAVRILNKVENVLHKDGKSPSSIAAAATFLACQETGVNQMKKNVAEIYGISTLTLTKHIQEISSIQSSLAKQKEQY